MDTAPIATEFSVTDSTTENSVESLGSNQLNLLKSMALDSGPAETLQLKFLPDGAYTFGLVMIVKNAAHYIRRILDNATVFDQIVIMDTGSTDGTLNIMAQYANVEVHEMEWPNDFSAARNAAHKFITTHTWMWLDSDDTFDDATQKGWRTIAGLMIEDRLDVALVPYIYAVDENGVPLVVQYRERIFRGTANFLWKEPIHEVCTWTGTDPENVKGYQAYPVVHKPVDNPVKGRRNWKILANQYLKGNRSDRILYYMARECNVAGEYEWAILLAKELAGREPGGYYEYEALKATGEAYSELYKRDGIKEYRETAIEWLQRAVRYEPSRNDARASLTDLFIFEGDTEAALACAKGLSETMPQTPATLLSEHYGTYRDAVLALINFKMLGNAYEALLHHMKALDTMRPHATCVELEKSLRGYIRDQNVGFIYADEIYVNTALKYREAMLRTGEFREVWITTDPKCLAYASNLYVHITDDEATLYQEDGHPHLRKMFVSTKITERPFGYHFIMTPTDDQEILDDRIQSIIKGIGLIYGFNLVDGLRKALSVTLESVIVNFTDSLAWPVMRSFQVDPLGQTVNAYFDKMTGDLLAIAGRTEYVCSMFIEAGTNTIRCGNKDSIRVTVVDNTNGSGVRARFENRVKPNKDIVFCAPGIEDWDGATPYRWGIGASESTLIYIAEEMVQRGHSVRVYTTCSRSRTVAGVHYMPSTMFGPDIKTWDLLVASRMTDVLMGPRKAKVQVLWMHDVAEAYGGRIKEEMVIDRFICVSDWQKERAEAMGLNKNKLVTVPNGLRFDMTEFSVRQPKRTIWISQPERGVHNIYNLWRLDNEELADFWTVYGFYNYLNYRPEITAEVLREVCMYKHMIRTMGGKIAGRISAPELRRLMATCERWVYPSTFAETFCVSGLEAANAGLDCYVTYSGATVETMTKFAQPGSFKVIEPEGRMSFDFAVDGQKWLGVLKEGNLQREVTVEDKSAVIGYDQLVNTWEALINGTL